MATIFVRRFPFTLAGPLLLVIGFEIIARAGPMVNDALRKREDRLRKSQVGDWVEYEESTSLDTKVLKGSQTKLDNQIRITVTQKDDQSVTLKIVRLKTGEAVWEEKVVFGQPRTKKDLPEIGVSSQ